MAHRVGTNTTNNKWSVKRTFPSSLHNETFEYQF